VLAITVPNIAVAKLFLGDFEIITKKVSDTNPTFFVMISKSPKKSFATAMFGTVIASTMN
jgi:hypothetical protein